jgi:hypothetical protein
MENISLHITYKEATRSEKARRYGWKNDPNPQQLERMTILAKKVFEKIRSYFGVPIYIWSMFRTPKVNKAAGGKKNSQHMADNGAAIDIDAQVFGGLTNKKIFDFVRKNLEFDQLIGEGWDDEDDDYDWIHISYNEEKNRNQVLVMTLIDGKPVYSNYKTN